MLGKVSRKTLAVSFSIS